MSSLLGSCVSPYGSPGLPFGVLWHPVTPQQRHELTFGSLCVPLWFPRAPFRGPMSPSGPTSAPWAHIWGPVGPPMGPLGSLLGSYVSQWPYISTVGSLLGSCGSPYGSPGFPFGVLWHPVTPQQRHELTFGALCIPLWVTWAHFRGPMAPNDPTAAP